MSRYVREYYNGNRYYRDTITGRKVPAVNTVIHQNSTFKGRPGNAAKLGSILHYHVLSRYSKEPLEIPSEMLWNVNSEEIYRKIDSGLKMWRDLKFYETHKILDIEKYIFNDDFGYAGTIDGDCVRNDEQYGIFDLKTGNDYPQDYDLQMSAYAKALGASFATLIFTDLNIDRNPKQLAYTRTLDQSVIDSKFEEFLVLLDSFDAKE